MWYNSLCEKNHGGDSMSPKNDTRRVILEAAKTVFANKGYDGGTMDEIASEAGVKKALIFYYFASKEDLFLGAWKEGIDELENHLFAEMEGEHTFLRKIKRLLRSYIDFVLHHKDIMKLIEMNRNKVLENDQALTPWPQIRQRYSSFMLRIEELIEEGKSMKSIPQSISTHATARIIANGMAMGAMDKDLSLDTVVQFILSGMSLPSESPT